MIYQSSSCSRFTLEQQDQIKTEILEKILIRGVCYLANDGWIRRLNISLKWNGGSKERYWCGMMNFLKIGKIRHDNGKFL